MNYSHLGFNEPFIMCMVEPDPAHKTSLYGTQTYKTSLDTTKCFLFEVETKWEPGNLAAGCCSTIHCD